MLVRIFFINGITDNLFFLNHMVLYISCLFVQDIRVVTPDDATRETDFPSEVKKLFMFLA